MITSYYDEYATTTMSDTDLNCSIYYCSSYELNRKIEYDAAWFDDFIPLYHKFQELVKKKYKFLFNIYRRYTPPMLRCRCRSRKLMFSISGRVATRVNSIRRNK